MATGMSTGWLERASEQARTVGPPGTFATQLQAAVPPMSTFKPWGWVVRPGVPGKLATYPTRVEHARAHRLAAERNRRDRRRLRKGRAVNRRFPSTGTVTWNLTIDTRGIESAFARAGEAIQRLGESMPSVVRAQLEDGSLRQLLSLYAGRTEDETIGPDTDYCASSNGARWSDLMADIDELVGEA